MFQQQAYDNNDGQYTSLCSLTVYNTMNGMSTVNT